MALAPMEKILIVAHRSQAAALLEALQEAGLVHLLDAAQAMVSKEWPELQTEFRRPKDLEDLIARLDKAIAFLESHAQEPSEKSLFSRRVEIDASTFSAILSGQEAMDLLAQTEQTYKQLEGLGAELEQTTEQLQRLLPWQNLTCRLEDLFSFSSIQVFAGLIGIQNLQSVQTGLEDLSCTLEIVGEADNRKACLLFVPKDQAAEVQKLLRSVEFEAAHLEGLKGTASELIEQCRKRLEEIEQKMEEIGRHAAQLARRRVELKVLFDYYSNLLERKTALATAPATEQTLFLEGWTKRKDYPRVEEIVRRFAACDVTIMIPMEGEEPPVEIENIPVVRPFESITRLYGMPAPSDPDPTVFLAPFFAVFFGLCMTDAAYGLIMLGFLWWLLGKLKGDKKFVWMMIFCSITTIAAGALTGGWCGDAIQLFLPSLDGLRRSVMWFDPMEKPMHFFALSLGLGYVQIIAGVAIAFFHKLRRGEFKSAVFDHLSWLVWLNSLAVFGLSKAGLFPESLSGLGTAAGIVALVPALMIILFSEREGGLGYRIGMGCYNLFSTVFYIGDILSYIRLMALGISSAGFGMAINVIAIQMKDMIPIPVVGWVVGALVFVGGHLFNVANSALSSFVHSMRLQFVEFFTKFLAGGGKDFRPLRKQYRHIAVRNEQE
jgi:V/A-type H+-transporting ATPase subunit I